MLCFSGVGALVAARRPTNPIGWLLLSEGVLWQLNQLAGDVRIFVTVTHPGLPGAAAAAWIYDVMWIPPVAALPLLFLLFPTGRLPSRRWRWSLVALAAGTVSLGVALGLRPGPFTSNPDIANPIGVEALRPAIDSLEAAGNLLVALGFFTGLASLIVRYRHSDPTTRQQLKWLALAVSVVVTAWTAANVLEAVGRVGEAGNLRSASLLLIPLACGTAVLKDRLYDIDLVLNKLVVYAGLAAFVVASTSPSWSGSGRWPERPASPTSLCQWPPQRRRPSHSTRPAGPCSAAPAAPSTAGERRPTRLSPR